MSQQQIKWAVGTYWVHGRINAGKALLSSSTPTSTPTFTPTPSPTTSPTPIPSPTAIPGSIVNAGSISYSTAGGKNNDKHLNDRVFIVDNNGNPVSQASVSIRLENTSSSQAWVGTGTTGSGGSVC